jgi:hypothetical protein
LRLIAFFFSKKVIPNFFIFLFAVVLPASTVHSHRSVENAVESHSPLPKTFVPDYFFLFAVVGLLQIAGNWRKGEKRWHLAFCGANKINAVNLCVKKFFICSKI